MRHLILIVEDDEPIRESLVELLESEGFSTIVASNGQKALDLLFQVQDLPHLILLDLMMPVKNGFEFCLEKSQTDRIAKIPVIVMSADGNAIERKNCICVRTYLKKPVDIDHLIEMAKKEICEKPFL